MSNKQAFEEFRKKAWEVIPEILRKPSIMKRLGILKQGIWTDKDIAEALRTPIDNIIKQAFNEMQTLVEFKEEIAKVESRFLELVEKLKEDFKQLKESTENSPPTRAFIQSLIDSENEEKRILEEIKKQFEKHSEPTAQLQYQVMCYLSEDLTKNLTKSFAVKMPVLSRDKDFSEKLYKIVSKVPSVEEIKRIAKFDNITPEQVINKAVVNCGIEMLYTLRGKLEDLKEEGRLTKENFPLLDDYHKAKEENKLNKFLSARINEIVIDGKGPTEIMTEQFKALQALSESSIKSPVQDLLKDAQPFLGSHQVKDPDIASNLRK